MIQIIRLRLPRIGVVNYHKDKPPDTIYFEDVIKNNSVIFPPNSECDFEYERIELTKLYKLKEQK